MTRTGKWMAIAMSLAAAAAAQQDPVPGVAAPDPAALEAFDAGLRAVHETMAKGRWPEARAQLLTLLGEHERQPFVIARREALVHDYTTCRFREQARAPELAELLTGELRQWSKASGQLELVYDGDFSDWQGDAFLVHPVVFAGSYSVRFEGAFYGLDAGGLRVLFDLDPAGEEWFVADFGVAERRPARVVRGDLESGREIARGESSIAPNRAFAVELRVTEKTVELRNGRKTFLSCKREQARLGRVAILRGTVGKIVLDGKVEPSWLQGRIDEALVEQRAAFEAKFVARVELPDWLYDPPSPTARTEALEKGLLPGDDAFFSDATDEVIALWRQGKVFEAHDKLRELQADDAPSVTLTYLEAVLALEAGYAPMALEAADRLVAEAPESGLSRLLRGRVLDALGRVPEALDDMRAAVALDPGNPRLYEWLAVGLLCQGDRDGAKQLLLAGKLQHGLVAELAALDLNLAMAERGPSFASRFEADSPHYHVVSDIDQKACRDACALLEQSYRQLKSQFEWLPDDPGQPRFEVFLFAGESGYQEYSRQILGEPMAHTAGLYSPLLKQLLIWNLPKREDMERTIVHEGFHQFLDRLMHAPPTWLNEGTAEYWETAKREGGRLKGGQLRRDHIATLSRATKGLPSLKNLVYGDRADFYANAHLRYAHAWGLVHYLRDGGRENRARYEALWRALRQPGSQREILDQVFEGLDWEEWERGFWKYLRDLGQGKAAGARR